MEIVELKTGQSSLCRMLRLRALEDARASFSETYEQAIKFDDSYWENISDSRCG